MTYCDIDPVPESTLAATSGRIKVLVVDDSRFQRRILAASLSKLGYHVTEAESGEEAMERCLETLPDMVLSDWMMPGMSGLEFCEAFRKISEHQYAYFIILTSKSEKQEIARGLDSGADDFLIKPVDGNELRARLSAGERILKMQREMRLGNRLLSDTLDELQTLYDSLDRDLMEAKTLQQSLLRERHLRFEEADLSLLLRSSGHVGGDLVGHFPAGQDQLGLFAIDVSGHGISSALMTARLAGYLSATTPEHNIALERQSDGGFVARPPWEVVSELNDLVLQEMATEHYFTLMLLIVDMLTGLVTIAQAGHPHPILQRKDGRIEQSGSGGFPVGLLEGVDFQQFTLQLDPGDRLLVLSDGVTECPDPNGILLEESGVGKLVDGLRHHKGPAFLDGLILGLKSFAKTDDFPDDVSAILFEYAGPHHGA
ncbi:MAG: SpoIIE family protein phosphatase [Sulfitobacter sp.]